ncbi:hypothetical protein [Serratia microhaemolytica]|uniref:hypothetical protein n=1 Tax=Serratia microhaemolytica TaxID=2675110 RepID=UPI000FDE0DBC|nr:hypothetical protein [Serratia microhaemolytica]
MKIIQLSCNNKWKLPALLLLLFSAQYAGAIPGPSGSFTAGSGFVWSGSVSSSWQGINSPTLTMPNTAAWGGMITDNFSSTNNVCPDPARFGTSSDGVLTGLILAPDVILGITSGTMQSSYTLVKKSTNTKTTSTVKGSWSSDGRLVSTALSNGPWCISSNNHAAGIYSGQRISNDQGSMSGTLSLYIGPQAPLGKVASPRLAHSGAYRNSIPGVREMLAASQFTIMAPTDCTVNFQDNNVAFGSVNNSLTDKQVLATYPSRLTVQCNSVDDGGSGSGQTALQLAFNGNLGRSGDSLALNDNTAQTLAEIRGIRATGGGDCTNTHSEQILFNNQPVTIANLGVGSSDLPLTWTLCSNGSRNYGYGTAQAIATLSWP